MELLTHLSMNPSKSFLPAILVALSVSTPAWATYMNVTDCPYCQTFDGLAASGTGTWRNDNTGFTGWFVQSSGSLSGGGAGFSYSASAGGSTTVGVYSFGVGSGSDRGLGAITGGSGAMSIAFGNLLYNNSGGTITSLTISYTGEQWRSASTSAQSILFSYAVASGLAGKFYDVDGVGARAYLSPGVVSGSDATGDNKGLSWVSASSGNFTSPNLTGSGAVTASTSINFTLTGLDIPNGSAIMMRWLDQSGNTDGLAIDNVCVSIPVAPVPETSTYAAVGALAAMVGGTAIRRKRGVRKA